MDIYTVLALLCVSSACCVFLGHAAGYRKGKLVERRQLRKRLADHNDAMGL